MNKHEYTELRGAPGQRLRQHLHAPTLEAVIEMLYRADEVESSAEAIRLVDAMRPPMEITTMGDLFGHVVDEGEMTQGQEQESQGYDDSCEICGVRCASTGFAPHPGLCVRCTAKVQQLQREKSPYHHYDED
jgi:hypothetical protein